MDTLIHVVADSGIECEEVMLVDSVLKGKAAIYFSKSWLKSVFNGNYGNECEEIQARIRKKLFKKTSSELFIVEHQSERSNDGLIFSFAQKLAVLNPSYTVVFLNSYPYFEPVADGINNLHVMSFSSFVSKYFSG